MALEFRIAVSLLLAVHHQKQLELFIIRAKGVPVEEIGAGLWNSEHSCTPIPAPANTGDRLLKPNPRVCSQAAGVSSIGREVNFIPNEEKAPV